MSQPERLAFIDHLNRHYAIRKFDFATIFEQYQFVYAFAFLKENNLHNINPKIYRNKSAFLNLGYDFRADLKAHFIVNNELIMLDFKQLHDLTTIERIFYSYNYGKYTGLIVGNSDHQERIFALIKDYISRYFSSDYTHYDTTHSQLFFGFLDEILGLDCHYILQTLDLQENIEPYCIYAKNSQDQILQNDSIFYFPFPKPYSDYVHW